MAVVVLSIFNACQKSDELIDQSIDVQQQEAVKPDVYSENGYLVFKEIEAVDSVVNILLRMTTEEKENWERDLGIKSARAEFERLNQIYDNLDTKEEILDFKSRYQNKLTFKGSEPEDWSIDYAFNTVYFVPVLNEDGVFKIGESLIKYTKNDHIIILDGDQEKLKNLNKFSNNEMVVYAPRLKSSDENRIYLDDFPDDNLDKDYGVVDIWSYNDSRTRRLRNELIWDNYYYSEGSNINSGWKLLFHQKGEKKGTFGWKRYKTVYGVRNIYVKVGSFPSQNLYYNVADYTPEVYYSTRECAADHLIGATTLWSYRPPVDFSSETYSQGLGVWYTVDHY
ncbi:DUF4848 domain-containing protein [uncultured Draconibacterium sp.]|uniref:DUF4848 domain-containing protein n=1 Tax=uncultured Draconibacterium sp. TaxID=1573823 RepID=UPI003217DF6C